LASVDGWATTNLSTIVNLSGGQPIEDVRRLRDEIDRRVQALLDDLETDAPVGPRD
jgi:hypothetical protein